MKQVLFFLTALVSVALNGQGVRINEIDSDQQGTDTGEFIEFFGPANTPLDGLVVVWYNGSSNQVYEAFDLDGFSLDENGFFVMGNAAVPNVDLIFDDNSLQNGPEAIALYTGNGEDFPNSTPITTEGLIDAIVYHTNDSDDLDLIDGLTPGQFQVNESANGNSADDAVARIPDGGAPFDASSYVTQLPTPGFTNVLQCDGGTLAFTGENSGVNAEACVDFPEAILTFQAETSTANANYVYILAEDNDNILIVFEEGSYDFSNLSLGTCHIWGFSYTGELVDETIEQGEPVSAILSTECGFLSENFLEVQKINCVPPACDGGTVFANGNDNSTVLCLNGNQTEVSLSHENEADEDTYGYVVTEDNGAILEVVIGQETYEFGNFAPGFCRIYGLSFTGNIIEDTAEQGEPVEGILSDDCASLSENFILVEKLDCEVSDGCSDLFFSEYVEGSSSNKALEIYNPTPFEIDLSNYTINTYNDGAAVPTNTFNMSGTLLPGETFVITNSNAINGLQNLADALSSVTLFNGNDATVLRNNGVIIDALGVIGVNNGKDNPWEVNDGEGSLLDHTLVRIPTVTEGSPNWEVNENQWIVYPSNTFEFLGSHSVVPCDYPETATVSFGSGLINVVEGNTVQVPVNIAFPIVESTVEVILSSSTATPGDDFEDNFPIELVFPEGIFAGQNIAVVTIEDMEIEDTENLILQLVPINGATVEQEFVVINIIDDDTAPPLYEISEVTENNENFVADSLGVFCELRGIVHGLNMNPDGLQFTLIDDTGGIGVFSSQNNFDYLVTEGDSLHIIGTIEQFNGLTQIVPEELTLIEQGLDLYEPVLVGSFDESTESEMIRVKCYELADPSQWTNTGDGFNVDLTNGDAVLEMRIDADTDIFGTDAPIGVFSVIGIGGQFDTDEPFDEGYQIIPRYLDDLSTPVFAGFEEPGTIIAGEPVSFVNESLGAAEYLWNFGDGNSSSDENPTHTYVEDGSYTITLTAFSLDGECSVQSTFNVDVAVGLSEYSIPQLSVYPNPSNGMVTLEYGAPIKRVDLLDASGRLVRSIPVNGEQQLIFDVSTLSKGMYLLEVFGSQHRTIQRIMTR